MTAVSKHVKIKIIFPLLFLLYFVEQPILQFSYIYILISKYMKFAMLFSSSSFPSKNFDHLCINK